MSDSNEQKPEVKPPAEIKRETLEVANVKEYTVFSYCVLAKYIKMKRGLLSGMLKKNPDLIVLSNCPRDPTDDSEVDTRDYQIRYNGGFYIFVHNDIPIVGCGPFPGEKRIKLETSEQDKAKCADVSYFYVDVQLKLQSGQLQTHRIVAVYHPQHVGREDNLCRPVVCEKLQPVLQGEEHQPITHICGALNWYKEARTKSRKSMEPSPETPGKKGRGSNINPLKSESIFADFKFHFKFIPTSEPGAEVSQIFVSEKEYSRWSWGALFTDTPETMEMREKPLHPNHFLEGDLKIKYETEEEKEQGVEDVEDKGEGEEEEEGEDVGGDEAEEAKGVEEKSTNPKESGKEKPAPKKDSNDKKKRKKADEIAAVVVFTIKPVQMKKSGTSAQTAEQPSTSVEVKKEVDPGVEEITTGVKETL